MDELRVSVVKKSEGVFILCPEGSIDGETYQILQKSVDALISPLPRALIFDMKGVNYISSMGLKVILRTKEVIEKGGGSALLMNLQPQISKVFDIIKAVPFNNIFSSVEEMDRYLSAMQRKEAEKRKRS